MSKRMRPIIFGCDMVLCILEGKKTVTRRIVTDPRKQPYYKGDVLWVREPLISGEYDGGKVILRLADGKHVLNDEYYWMLWPWKNNTLPAMFMPKSCCRIWLKVTGIKQAGIDEMKQEDYEREGFRGWLGFMSYWDRLYFRQPEKKIENDPQVWVIEFKVERIEG